MEDTIQTCPNLSKLVQTCLTLSKLVLIHSNRLMEQGRTTNSVLLSEDDLRNRKDNKHCGKKRELTLLTIKKCLLAEKYLNNSPYPTHFPLMIDSDFSRLPKSFHIQLLFTEKFV